MEKGPSQWIRLIPFLVLLGLFTTLGCQKLVTKPENLGAALPGAQLFRSKCGKCHDLELALDKYRSKKVWYDTISRMREVHHADISRAEVDELVRYHVARQKREAAIFKEKCQKCHPGKVFLEKNLTPDQARAIIKRMQKKAGNTIENKDVEIIVRYHIRAQQAEVEKTLNAVLGRVPEPKAQPGMKKGMELFVQKCSACHSLSRALSVIKDPQAWAITIKRMERYSKGAITNQDAKELIAFHIARQQKEIDAFRNTCTKCHSDARINSRSMSEKQWLATIKRMQRKAPKLITDEKVALIAAYFHRRELTMARIFYDKCRLCHYDKSGKALRAGSTAQMDGLIVLADQQFGQSLEIKDVNNLLSLHVQRQKRVMQLYQSDCRSCHTGGVPEKKKSESGKRPGRSRSEWIAYIATLQGVELSKSTQNAINNQIEFHISRH